MKPLLPRNLSELQTSVNTGNQPKYLFFWGHTPKLEGSVDQSCLSNWFPAEFEAENTNYKTAEHYMMAEKASLFGDRIVREEILNSRNPAEAKKLGRKVAGFEQERWEKCRYQIVVDGCYAKFTQNREMKEYLIQTKNRVLVEASPVDLIWGIGLAADHKDVDNPNKWRGPNLLGFALMEVRSRLIRLEG